MLGLVKDSESEDEEKRVIREREKGMKGGRETCRENDSLRERGADRVGNEVEEGKEKTKCLLLSIPRKVSVVTRTEETKRASGQNFWPTFLVLYVFSCFIHNFDAMKLIQ